jgi:hypothetical protein
MIHYLFSIKRIILLTSNQIGVNLLVFNMRLFINQGETL